MNQQYGLENNHEDDEISLLDIVAALGEGKTLILGVTFIAAVAAIVISLFLPPSFTASTTVLPPQNSGGGGAAAALASLGGLANLAGVSVGGTTSDSVIAMLKSRSAKDQVIDQFKLLEHYGIGLRQDAYGKLDRMVKISTDKKSTLIMIEVEAEDPEFAASLANAYYDALKALMNRVALTDAQRRRQFFEVQLTKAKDDLADAEVKLKETQEKTGVLELKKQAEATIESIAALRAEVAQREVQLSAMRTFATVDNADYKRVSAELSGLKAELRKLEKGADNEQSSLVSADNLPEQGLEYVRALRNVKYFEAIFEVMAKQFELAKVEEAKDGGDIQQLDVAVPPERKSKPKRAFIVILSTLGAAFFAILFVLGRDAFRKAAQNPQNSEKIQKVFRAWKFRN